MTNPSKRYRATFTGRTKDAIGAFSRHTVEIEVDGNAIDDVGLETAARLALYETHDHIQGLKLELAAPEFAYIVQIASERDQITLEWLNARGYDAGFLDEATFLGRERKPDGTDGPYVYGLKEHQAWEVNRLYQDDPGAFLACNGSDTLNSALLGFIDSIV